MALTGSLPPPSSISLPPQRFRLPKPHFPSIRSLPSLSDSSALSLVAEGLLLPAPSQKIAPCSPQLRLLELSDTADLVYQRLHTAPAEDIKAILESAQRELPLVELRSIVERFDEHYADLMKSIRVIQWARKQKYFHPYEDKETVYCLQKEQVEVILMEFLRSTGRSHGLSTRVMKKSSRFVEHLHSILFRRYPHHYTQGETLTMLQMKDILFPYLEALAARHQDGLMDILVEFPDPPVWSKVQQMKDLSSITNSSVKRDGGGNCGLTFNGNFRPSVSYALSLGLSLQQVQVIANRYPKFLFYGPQKKMKPIVNYFLALGVTKQVILKILVKRPQVFGCDLEDNLKPTMRYLESIGVDRRQWPGMLGRYPMICTCGRDRIQQLVIFLQTIGFSSLDVKRTLSRYPYLVTYDIKEKFEPLLIFLDSMGVRAVGSLLRSFPPVLGYSIEGNIKPTINFLIEIGYSETDVITIIQKYPEMLGLAINTDLKPKWDYYVWTGWPKSNLLSFPHYFGYSLDAKIKPRFEKVLRDGVCWTLGRILSSSDTEFERLLGLEKDTSG